MCRVRHLKIVNTIDIKQVVLKKKGCASWIIIVNHVIDVMLHIMSDILIAR